MIKKLYKKKTIQYFLIIFFIGCLFRYLYFIQLDGWFDEWNMLYTIDPNISNDYTWKRYYGDRGDGFLPEYYPPLNAFLLKYILKIFGYSVENTRLISLIFGCFSIYLVFYLSNILTTTKNSLTISILYSLNLFLIWQSSEIRPHSFVVFFALLSIIFFFKLENKKFKSNEFDFLTYAAISLILLSSWPFTLIIFFSKLLYFIQKIFLKRNLNKNIFLTLLLIILLYVLINFEYLIYHLNRDEHYTKLYFSFFYSYHFRSFFGSIMLGGIFLIIFSFLFVTNVKNILNNNNKINLIIITIILSYLLTILYSLIGASVISPKYIIFIVPLIIIWIIITITNNQYKFKNHLIIFLILISTINLFLNFKNNPIDRPPTKKILELIKSSEVKTIYTSESEVFNNFLKNHNISKKNIFEINKINNLKVKDKSFWFLCLNNPRFAVGDNNLPDEIKCDFFKNKKNYLLKNEIRKVDYILRLYEKKN